jgi:NAD+ synthase (glutamine-hydrolysing)
MQKCDLMVNLSASPWHTPRAAIRQNFVVTDRPQLGCPVAYVNAVGGNDELVFDGRSLVATPRAGIIAGLAAFAEDLRVVGHRRGLTRRSSVPALMHDLRAGRDEGHPRRPRPRPARLRAQERLQARPDRLVRRHRFRRRRRDRRRGFRPGKRHRRLPALRDLLHHSRDDARKLAANLGIRFETIAIADAVAAVRTALGPIFAGLKPDVTEENIQARIRGVLMMALSNKFGSLLLTTGNKSEVAVGYCTLYGDMCGGLAVISDVFKMQVYALSRWINREREIIPHNTIEKPRAPSCGPARPTRTACRPTTCSTRS